MDFSVYIWLNRYARAALLAGYGLKLNPKIKRPMLEYKSYHPTVLTHASRPAIYRKRALPTHASRYSRDIHLLQHSII